MISRRHFLQFTASTLATLGVSYFDIFQKSKRYAQLLAQDTPRKLALLVGINQYPTSERFTNLGGCVTDVDLQEELLIHRFGFNQSDILRLTSNESPNKQPTRSNILTAFEEHLIKQAKPGDVVVFHFSGHGSRLRELEPIQKCRNDDFNSTFVPADDEINGIANDIMGRTLFLLMSALNTDNVTAVLDSCYSGGGTRGNLLIRSVSGEGLQPSPQEIAYQNRWLEQLNLTSEELVKRRCTNVAKGVVIAAAQRDQEATDAIFNDFHVGLFTYLMTQYLWQETELVSGAIARIIPSVRAVNLSQTPLTDGDSSQPVYFINKKLPPADAVITQVRGEKVDLWLGGLDSEGLEAFNTGATFAIVSDREQVEGSLQLESRQGLRGKAKLIKKRVSLQPGMLLQESSRVIPSDLRLHVGIDASLVNEIKAIQELLSTISRLEVIPSQSGNLPYPAGVQYIFSRLTTDYQKIAQRQQAVNLPKLNSLGLFTQGLEIVPQSFGEPEETVAGAVSRLTPTLKSLVAAYIIKQVVNANSSNLAVEVSLNLVEQPNKILAKAVTKRSKANRQSSQPLSDNKLPLNKLFQFQVTNHDDSNFYFTMLLLDSTGGILVIFPYQWPASDESMKLAAQQTRAIGDSTELQLKATDKGRGEMILIVSRTPLKKSVKALRTLAEELNQRSGGIELMEPVEVVGDLLADLTGDRARGIGVQSREVKASETATISLTFEVG